MRKKLLLAALAASFVVQQNVWADDVYKDVTSQYLTNADFEGNYSVYSYPKGDNNKDRAIYQPDGWTIAYKSGDSNDMTALNSECLQWDGNFKSKAQLENGGSNTYWIRLRWGKGATLELSQTVTLSKGTYRLTAAYYKNGTGGDGYIFVGSTTKNTNVNEDVWKSLTIDFNSDGVAATKLGCRATHTDEYEKFLAFDNFLLEWNVTQALSDLIDNVTAEYNKDTSKTELKAAIDEATEKKESTDADEIVAAINTLQQAYEDSFKASATDYANLNAAINAVKEKTWGFDADEYAPYNYVEVLTALAAAEAIDQTAFNTHDDVQALITTLNGVTWTANTGEVNAIFDGKFVSDYSDVTADGNGNKQTKGWCRIKGTTNDGYNVRYVTSSGNAGLAAVGGYGMFTKFGAYYGWADGYTMPLNEDTYYTISFMYGGWGDCKKDGYVTLTDPKDENLSLITSADLPVTDTDANSNQDSWKSYSAFFKTNDAGDYVLGLRKKNESMQSQYVYGDFKLVKSTVAEATAYYNSVLAEVSPSYDADANGGTEKTAFKAAIDVSMEGKTVAEIMEAAAALPGLRDAFVAATPKYELYLAEKANAERIDASITAGITAPTTADEADAVLKTILVNEYNYVKDNFNADAAEAYGITIDKWTGTATSGGKTDTPQTRSNEKWGDAATTYYEQGSNGWGSSAWTLNYTKTVTLPANTYVLKVAARASEGTTATLKATIGETTITEALPSVGAYGMGITTSGVASFDESDDFARDDEGYGWQWRYLAFTLGDEAEVTLQIDASANSSQQWCSFGDVAVVSNVTIEALTAAYNNFEMKTLGFEKDQYAPYNNVDLLEAYAEAKAIVEGTKEPSTQPAVDALTTTLTTASWIPNTADVDAIFNGDFSEGDWTPTAWTSTGWAAKVDNINESNTISKTGKGWRPNTGTITYGTTGVYTMPLAGEQVYKLTFKYGAWDGSPVPTISVLKAEDGLAATKLAGTSVNYKTAMTSQTMYFKTGEVGDYVLSMNASGNMVWTDVSLVKAAADEVTLSEAATEPIEAAYYQTLNTLRTLKGGQWNGFSAPFGFTVEGSALEGAEVKKFASVADNEITLEGATEIVAGEPYLVKPADDIVNPTFKAIAVSNPEEAEKGTDDSDYKFKAHLYNTALATDGSVAYVSTTDSSIKKLTKGGIKGMRSIFLIPTGSEAKALRVNFGNNTTGIMTIDNEGNIYEGQLYNLAGQRVGSASSVPSVPSVLPKGVYIANGKKVMIK